MQVIISRVQKQKENYIYDLIFFVLPLKSGISPIGALRAFWEDSGWFSNAKLRYFSFSLVRMVGIYCYNDLSSSNILNPQNTVLPSSLVEKSAILKMPENTGRDLMNVFKAYNTMDLQGTDNNNNIFSNKNIDAGNNSEDIVKAISAVMAISAKTFEGEFSLISGSVSGNFSIRKGIEILRNMNYFEYSSRNKN